MAKQTWRLRNKISDLYVLIKRLINENKILIEEICQNLNFGNSRVVCYKKRCKAKKISFFKISNGQKLIDTKKLIFWHFFRVFLPHHTCVVQNHKEFCEKNVLQLAIQQPTKRFGGFKNLGSFVLPRLIKWPTTARFNTVMTSIFLAKVDKVFPWNPLIKNYQNKKPTKFLKTLINYCQPRSTLFANLPLFSSPSSLFLSASYHKIKKQKNFPK